MIIQSLEKDTEVGYCAVAFAYSDGEYGDGRTKYTIGECPEGNDRGGFMRGWVFCVRLG